jgi:hypothetical protein
MIKPAVQAFEANRPGRSAVHNSSRKGEPPDKKCRDFQEPDWCGNELRRPGKLLQYGRMWPPFGLAWPAFAPYDICDDFREWIAEYEFPIIRPAA